MLRLAIVRSRASGAQGFQHRVTRQWLPQRLQYPSALPVRSFADDRPVDKTIVPGAHANVVAGVPQAPIQATVTSNPTPTTIPPSQTPRVPPSAEEVGAKPPTADIPAPKRPRRRFRNFLLTLIALSTLGYAGGVYYSLVSDNFHDFFTEYVPYGEDAVAYFEEREFRKRFPSSLGEGGAASKSWPQKRGENKVTIGRQSGLQAKVAEAQPNGSSGPGAKGKHVSALEDEKKSAPAASKKDAAPAQSRPAKTASAGAETKASQPEAKPAPAAPAVAAVDHLNVQHAEEPVVQDLVKLVNNIITAVNASSEANKLAPTVASAKEDLQKAIASIATLREQAAAEADTKIKDAHVEFDTAAKELVRRLESEMQDQESKWRDEYENERERLGQSYNQKLAAELEAAKRVADEKSNNALLEQEIALQKNFIENVKKQVEDEREGRLSKLDELSGSVSELEKLTSEWNSVVDATLQTQHLQVALEAVRAKLSASDIPTPFLNELVALKEVSNDDDVVSAAIASIPPVAYQRGIPSAAALIDRFRRVSAEVRKASLLPADAGVASHAASAVLSRFMFQKKSDRGLPEGDDVEATLARTEVLLEEGDLDAAAREMNALQGWAGVLSKDWVSECRRVLEVKQAVDVIATAARLQSLQVE